MPSFFFLAFLLPPGSPPLALSCLAPSISLPTRRPLSSTTTSVSADIRKGRRKVLFSRRCLPFPSPCPLPHLGPFHRSARSLLFVFTRADWTLRACIRESSPRRGSEKVKAKWKSATPFLKIVREIHSSAWLERASRRFPNRRVSDYPRVGS